MYGRCVYCFKTIKCGPVGVWETLDKDNFCEDNDFYNFHEPFIKLKVYTNDA